MRHPADCAVALSRPGNASIKLGEWLMELTLSHTRAALPLRELLSLMALAREGDRREGILLRQGKGWFQVSGTGHEALAAVGFAMWPDDYLFPYYRDRALVMTRGVSNYDLALAY